MMRAIGILLLLTIVTPIFTECPGGGEPPPLELPLLPSAYMAQMMMNLQHDSVEAPYLGYTRSLYETADSTKKKALVLSFTELAGKHPDGIAEPVLLLEQIIWNPELSGIKYFLSVTSSDDDGNIGSLCMADQVREDSITGWMFGFDPTNPGESIPSIAGMVHMNTNFTPGCPTIKRGIEVNTFQGTWAIPAWDAQLRVVYYWSDPERWLGTAGVGRSVPVTAELQGMATIGGKTGELKMTIDYTNFQEVSLPDEAFDPPSDLWCDGRQMVDGVPTVPEQLSYTAEVVYTYKDGDNNDGDTPPGMYKHVIIPRREWFFPEAQVSRMDFKPLTPGGPSSNPFDSHNGMISQVNDFLTGLSYLINKDWGNCSISTIEETGGLGSTVVEGGRLHMQNPFTLLVSGELFARNGLTFDRGMVVESFIHTGPLVPGKGGENITTAFFLTSLKTSVENGHEEESQVPAKMVHYMTDKYNDPLYKVPMNIFHFSRSAGDFSVYDISACYEDHSKLHLMIRMGWTPEMDIEGTRNLFERSVREVVVIWGHVTQIRVVNVEYDIDPDHMAFYLIFTVLDTPPSSEIELDDLPDSVRPNDEVLRNIVAAVDKGWFKLPVSKNDGRGGKVVSKAEPGSTHVLGDRTGRYTHTVGYSSGAMWALGLVVLLVTVAGVLAVLVYVLKW